MLRHYTPVASYYRLAKTVEDDPEFDARKAQRKLRRFVEGHDHAIRLKAEIMVDHFHDQVLARNKIGGHARAMVVTNGIARAMQYYHAIEAYLRERKSPHRAIVAFSGEHDYAGESVTEASLNGFPSRAIAERIREEPYRFLVCADKFQTGYDEPLLHTMYVDKRLSDIKAVQTLSRLNRSHPKKHDVFVLDFENDTDTIRDAFADYYRTTVLADETDPNKLHDLQAELDGAQVYSTEQVETLVRRFVGGEDRDRLRSDPRRMRCGLQGRPRRRRPSGVQGQRQGIRSNLRVPFLRAAVHQRRVGGTLDLPQLPDSEAAVPRGGRSFTRHPRSHRHGQLPGGEAGHAAHPAPGRGCRNRSRTDGRRRRTARTGDRAAVEHHSASSTTSSGTSSGRTRITSGR